VTRGKKKHAWRPMVCHSETMRPRYRKGKPGMFVCRHCGNVRPQRVRGRHLPVYGKSPVEGLIRHQMITRAAVEALYPSRSVEDSHLRNSAEASKGGRP
jgi:hypothetical protein